MRSWPNAAWPVILAMTLTLPAEGREIRPTAAAFLDIDVNVRSAAMAATGMAMAEGPQAIYSNPADLSRLQGQTGAIMHAAWFQGLSLEWVGYGAQIGRSAGASAALTFLRSDALTRYDIFGEPEGEFRVYDAALSVGYGQRLGKRIHLGLTVKGVHQSVDDVTANGVAADFGASVDAGLARFALTATNLGPEITMDGEAFPLPAQLGVGSSTLLFKNKVTLTAAAIFPQYYYDDLRVGVELRPMSALALRAGYRHILEQGSEDQLTGFTGGVGFWVSSFRIDYGYQPFEDLGDTHRLGISLALDTAARNAMPHRQDSTRDYTTIPPDTAPPPPAENESATPTQAASPPEGGGAGSSGAGAAAVAAGVGAAIVASTDSKGSSQEAVTPEPIQEPESTGFVVVAGTHARRISALQELRLLRVGGLEGGDIERLDDGRYRVMLREFDSQDEATRWVDKEATKYGSFGFRVVARP